MSLPRWLIYLLLAAGSIWILSPYLYAIIWTIILAIALYPVYLHFPLRSSTGRSLILSLGYLAIIIFPVSIFSGLALKEFINYFSDTDSLSPLLIGFKDGIEKIPYIGHIIAQHINDDSLRKFLSSINISTIRSSVDKLFVANSILVHLAIGLIISTLLLYQFLKNAEKIKSWLSLLLLPKIHNPLKLLDCMILSLRGSVVTLLTSALLSSVVMTIFYFALSLPIPLFLGLVTFVCALVPFLLIVFYIVLAVILLLSHQLTAALTILIAGIILNLFTDNIMQPKILAYTVEMPFYISFIGILSGLACFGFLGIFVGPALLYTTLRYFGNRQHSPGLSIKDSTF